MRYYDSGSTRAWAKEYRESNNAANCLYLVPDPNNKHDKNAIMLHDGKKVLGYVQASEAPHITEMLKGTEDVYCVYVTQLGHAGYSYSEPSFLRVTAFCKVDERLARKYKCEPDSKATPATHKKNIAKHAISKTYESKSKWDSSYKKQKGVDRADWVDNAWIPEWQCKKYGFDE